MWSSSAAGRRGRTRFTALAAVVLLWGGLATAADMVLPASLAKWYKPQNKRQVWLHTMFAMRRELQAVREYAEMQDAEHAASWAQRLATHYHSLAEMVPEWRDETDPSLVEALQQQLAAGDFTATVTAVDRLDRDCRSCHRQFQALAALKYRWPDFSTLRVSAADGSEHAFGDHMELLSTTLNRIKIASEDARWPVAATALGELRTQLDALGNGCQACHDDPEPRARILGTATTTTLERLAEAIGAQDVKTSGRLLGEAAVQSCARCHGVHRLLAGIRQQLFD